jgi:hypothetical protein
MGVTTKSPCCITHGARTVKHYECWPSTEAQLNQHSPTNCSDNVKKRKAIPIIGRGGLQGCEMLRMPHCPDNRLTDGSQVVSLARRPRFTPQKHYFFNVYGIHFC